MFLRKEAPEAMELFTTKFLSPREGFVSRFNKPFEAALELIQEETKTGKKGKFKFMGGRFFFKKGG